MVGLPGSGKSTVLLAILQEEDQQRCIAVRGTRILAAKQLAHGVAEQRKESIREQNCRPVEAFTRTGKTGLYRRAAAALS